jgi:hypothetical protein
MVIKTRPYGAKLTIKLSILVFCILSFYNPRLSFSQAPDTIWTKKFGGTDSDQGFSVQQTDDGGYIIVGSTRSFGAGGSDVYLIKTDSCGNALWTKTYGGSGDDSGYGVQQTSDRGYIIAGSFDCGDWDVWILKTDSLGDTVWTRRYGGANFGNGDHGYAIQEIVGGGYICTGAYGTSMPGDWDIYLICMDTLGDSIWTKHVGFYATDDRGRSVQQTRDGGYIVAGYSAYDVCILKTTAAGSTQWLRVYGDPTRQERSYSVRQRFDDGYVVVGYSGEGSSFLYGDIWMLSVGTSGNLQSSAYFTYGGHLDAGYSVQQTCDSGYVIAGCVYSPTQNYQVCLLKTDSSGNLLWLKVIGGPGLDYGYSVQQTSDIGYIIAGRTNPGNLATGNDVWLLKIAAEPGVEESSVSALHVLAVTIIPNPFSSGVDITWQIPEGIGGGQKSEVGISIYDVAGRLIRGFYPLTPNALHPAHVFWDGKDDSGNAVSAGVYFVKLGTNNYSTTRKVLLVK